MPAGQGADVELQAGRDRAQLAQRARLELADALAGDAEAVADLLERVRPVALEAEPHREHVAHARVERLERLGELPGAQVRRRLLARVVGAVVLDQVRVARVAVADRRLQRHRVLDEVEEFLDALLREARLDGDLRDRRVAVQLLRELPPGAHHAPRLLRHVDGQANDAPLVGERAGDGLPDPPGRVGRELVAHRVVELLDRADQAEVALLDQVEQRHAGLRVVARDRHHESEVRLDQLPLGGLVAEILAAGELALLRRRQEPAVADLADVELERILGRDDLLGRDGLALVRVVVGRGRFRILERRQQSQLRLAVRVIRRVRKRLLHRRPYRRIAAAA